MIISEELDRLYKLLIKHQSLIKRAFLNNGEVDETTEDLDAIDKLIDARILWQPASDEPVRLKRSIISMFEDTLQDARRQTIDADIAQYIKNLKDAINHYKYACKHHNTHDAELYIDSIERIIDDLTNSLKNTSNGIWQKIHSEFGYVTSLELKRKENSLMLARTEELLKRIELIFVSDLGDDAGSDPILRRYIHKWLLSPVEEVRLELRSSQERLKQLLFEIRKQQRLGKMIDSFYRQYQIHPGYKPLNYAEIGDIPPTFNSISPLTISAHENTEDEEQALIIQELLRGLRKEQLPVEEPEVLERIAVEGELEPKKIEYSPLRSAVNDFFDLVIEKAETLSALKHLPPAELEPDPNLWLSAVISKYNNLSKKEARYFEIAFEESVDAHFSGKRYVHDVFVRLRTEAIEAA